MPRIAPESRQERRKILIDAAWRCAATMRFGDLTVDDVCAAAGVSKGAFYGYFESKQDLLLALLDQDAAELDRLMDELDASALDNTERLRRFTRAMLELGDQPARVQVRADLWADILTDSVMRARFSATIQRRRATMRRWLEAGIASGELLDVPTNAVASILLALSDGLLLHAGLDTAAFRWSNIQRALDALLAALAPHAPLPDGGSVRPQVS
ncbi:MAG TPA: TetR/AcrR family transcriptional regulator [Chloroflexota bacterium]|nr:TetR/AcrR family transcriptional regulator [Chloroflexota bacterium]